MLTNNTITLDPRGFIYQVYLGNQNYESVNQARLSTLPLISQLRAQNKPVLILADIREVKSIDAGSRIAGLEVFKNLDFDRYAVFVGSVYLKFVVKFVVSMSGRKEQVGIFDKETEAVDFLLSYGR